MVTAATGMWLASTPGVYWAQADVIFLAPTSSRFPNALNTSSGSVIMTAGIVQHDVIEDSNYGTSSSSVTLVDQGVVDGTMVRLPNVGGQWAYNYAEPVLDVQAVANTPEEVARRMIDLELAIQAALARRQDAAGVDKFDRITVQTSPSSLEVQYRGGDRRRAMAVIVLLGMAVTVSVVAIADRKRLQVRGIYLNPGRHSAADSERRVVVAVVEMSAQSSGATAETRAVLEGATRP